MIDEKIRTYNRLYQRKRRGGGARMPKQYENSRERFRLIRIKCLTHYSNGKPQCACCGEDEIKFLSIDHIDGGGNIHRKTFTKDGKGGNIAWWLKKNGWPTGFQVLCHNCNMAKGFYGTCPHVVDKK